MSDHSILQKRCKKCNTLYPATNEFFYYNKGYLCSPCKECISKANKEYSKKNPEKVATNKKKWQQTNREKVYRSTRNWMKNNPEHVEAYYQQYYQEHKLKYRERNRKWQQNNPEKSKEYDRRYREKHPLQVRAKFAKRRNAPGSHTRDDILIQYKSQKGKCWWCGKKVKLEKCHVDHRIPINRGGSNNPNNIVISCPHCNMSRGDKLPHEWGDRLL